MNRTSAFKNKREKKSRGNVEKKRALSAGKVIRGRLSYFSTTKPPKKKRPRPKMGVT